MVKIGDRVECIMMDDVQAVPAGTQGTVYHIDDMGTIHVRWDNGSGLGLIPGVDQYKIINGGINMEWNDIVNDFERICVLKTCLYYRIDENYLTIDDLQEIKEIAEVELEIIKLHPIYHDDLHGTLVLWRSQVYKKFEELQEKMYGGK